VALATPCGALPLDARAAARATGAGSRRQGVLGGSAGLHLCEKWLCISYTHTRVQVLDHVNDLLGLCCWEPCRGFIQQ
jgi:hypothetical protein